MTRSKIIRDVVGGYFHRDLLEGGEDRWNQVEGEVEAVAIYRKGGGVVQGDANVSFGPIGVSS